LFLTAILGLLPVPRLMDHLLGYIARVLPADAASLLTKTLGEVIKGARGSLVSLGVLGALWGASSGMVSISNALNVAFEVRVTPGASFALSGWLLAAYALRLYVTSVGNYNATYGSIGGVILLMLWFYLSSLALLVGAEINSQIRRAEDVGGPEMAPPIGQAKGATPPSGSPGPRSERPGEPE